jgi:hypothetical protein
VCLSVTSKPLHWGVLGSLGLSKNAPPPEKKIESGGEQNGRTMVVQKKIVSFLPVEQRTLGRWRINLEETPSALRDVHSCTHVLNRTVPLVGVVFCRFES